MSLDLISERYAATGSMVAKTLTRAVRNTELDEWAVLLRETLQNSVDARLDTGRPIDYFVSLDRATAEQKRALKSEIFGAEVPKELGELASALKQKTLHLLTIADWGTRGLGGPTRADTVTKDRTDFRDFFFNVGREEAKSFQGGTFGLGRGVLFDISAPATIVVFTKSMDGGKPVTRLMGMSLTATYDRRQQRFTGRHWWADGAEVEHPVPVTGARAQKLARQIGLDVIPEDSRGTAIMVIAPRIPAGSATDEVMIDEMIRAATKYGLLNPRQKTRNLPRLRIDPGQSSPRLLVA